ncbi:MAG: hypothetical protein ACRDLL_03550 [Solirubrobacterales bacterium]
MSACAVPAQLVKANAGGIAPALGDVAADRSGLAPSIGSTRPLHFQQALDLTVCLFKRLGIGKGLTPAEREVT